jgi:hypothetical protein
MTGPNQDKVTRTDERPSTGESLRADELSSRIDALLTEIGGASHRLEDEAAAVPLVGAPVELPTSERFDPSVLTRATDGQSQGVGDYSVAGEPTSEQPLGDLSAHASDGDEPPADNQSTRTSGAAGLGDMSESELEDELAAQANAADAQFAQEAEIACADDTAEEPESQITPAFPPSNSVEDSAAAPIGRGPAVFQHGDELPGRVPQQASADAQWSASSSPAPMSLDQLDQQLAEITEALPPDSVPTTDAVRKSTDVPGAAPQSLRGQPAASHSQAPNPAANGSAAGKTQPHETPSEPKSAISGRAAGMLTASSPLLALLGGPVAKCEPAVRSMLSLCAAYTLVLGAGAWIYLGFFRPAEHTSAAVFDFEHGRLADVNAALSKGADSTSASKEAAPAKSGH